ncbi:MAG: tetratricopeptide repeat protein [Acidobacteria bacterium]|nr:tetratricopeptide repeat protein [Acidobacteriota bacterium]
MEKQASVKKASVPKTVSRTPDRGSLRAMLMVDSGDFVSAKVLLEAEQATAKKDPYRETLRAEVALYYGRYDEVDELLRQGVAQLAGARSVARWTLARGQLHYCRHDYGTARDLFQGALSNYQYLGDGFGAALALYYLGQLERRLGHYEAAQTALTQALSSLDGKGRRGEFLSGLIQFNLGICKQQQALLDEAQQCYDASLSLLRQTEGSRYYGLALNSFGTLLQDRGQYDLALDALEEAANIAESQGTEEDAAIVRWNLGQCLLRANKVEVAEVVLRQAQELNAKVGNKAGVCATLGLLAQLYLDQNAMEKAEQCAREALVEAQSAGDEHQTIVAQIMLARICILRGKKDDAQELLLAASTSTELSPSPMLKAQCLMYLAECCLPKRAPEAHSYLEACEALLQGSTEQKMMREFQRIRTKATHSRIRLTQEGDLIISKSFLPEWGEAKEAVESFLIKHALEQADDNNTRAAKILAISKVHLCEKRKQYKL